MYLLIVMEKKFINRLNVFSINRNARLLIAINRKQFNRLIDVRLIAKKTKKGQFQKITKRKSKFHE